ncbi:MAG TPA: hypothetical protein VKX39_12130 [Bryobacteraceae bacterium]|jgi:hypothetical protein|nr:hypothetical protein [Bryobacteraceae bacterium]
MDPAVFDLIEQDASDPEAVFDRIAEIARREKNYHLLFGSKMMRMRLRLSLPLIDTEELPRLSNEQRCVYEQAFREAARESGELLLAEGDIAGAWQYFKAIDEPAPVAAAIDRVNEDDPNLDRVIHIAYQEGVHRLKGFDLCLKHHGICTAITWFGANPDSETRERCLEMLVASLYHAVAVAIRETIAAAEGAAPAGDSLDAMIADRAWLFEGISSYVDATHLTSILRFAPELRDQESLRMAVDLADYGQRLNPMYHFRGDPPFENTYRDHAIYLRALAGENPDAAIAHFRAKIRGPGDSMPARVFVELLLRLGRKREAVEAALEYLPPEISPENFALAFEVCQAAGDFKTLRRIARDRGDLLSYAAATIQEERSHA